MALPAEPVIWLLSGESWKIIRDVDESGALVIRIDARAAVYGADLGPNEVRDGVIRCDAVQGDAARRDVVRGDAVHDAVRDGAALDDAARAGVILRHVSPSGAFRGARESESVLLGRSAGTDD